MIYKKFYYLDFLKKYLFFNILFFFQNFVDKWKNKLKIKKKE